MYPIQMERLLLELSAEMKHKLDDKAKELGVNRTALLRLMINAALHYGVEFKGKEAHTFGSKKEGEKDAK